MGRGCDGSAIISTLLMLSSLQLTGGTSHAIMKALLFFIFRSYS